VSKNSITRFTTLLFVLVVSVALVCADLVVLAQNANSSQDETTRGGMMTSQNDNTSGGTTTRRRRRPRRRARANANMAGDATMSGDTSANANMSGDATLPGGTQANANMDMGTSTRRRGRRNRRRATTDMSGTTTDMTGGAGMTTPPNQGGEQTDLSGTYTGTVNYPEGGLNGQATLTITGNNFTITPEGGGSAVNGRVTAVTTRGYTGVTMMFGDPTAPPPTQNPPPPPLPTVSLQARRSGDRVTLKSVPGEKRQFSFSSGGTTGGTGRRRGRRNRGMTSSGTGMESTTPTGDMSGTTTPSGDTMGATTTTGTGRRRRRGRRNRTSGINGNMNTNGSMGGNTNGNTTPPQ
jgi:hypothetical protein